MDVVVVGAGFAGLSAARELTRLGHDVLVLEGRSRVGGRSSTTTIAGVPVDLGGTFVGPTQDEVLKLAADLGCETTSVYDDGTNLILWRGKVRAYRGTIPRLSPLALLDIGRIRWQFARLARGVPVPDPWTARHAQRLDRQSLEDWLHTIRASRSSRDLMAIVSRVTWGCEPDRVSLLHALRYVKAAGGLDRMLDVRGGAQQDRFPAGTQEIAVKMATELGPRVLLDSAVRVISWGDGGVTVGGDERRVEARFAIIAVPPEHRAGIKFAPPLPDAYARLAAGWPQGRLSKAYAAYHTPFWRADRHSGQALLDEGPVFITFDASPDERGPGILLGFTDARTFDPLPPDLRRQRALSCLASVFGEAARTPIDYVDHCWGTERFAPGAPTAAVPPGSWTSVGPWLRQPVGPIHWAGTETADVWTGFLDGAVRSGKRAAAEVAARLAAS